MSTIQTATAPVLTRKRDVAQDRSAFYATIRPSDVFLCTYPKSGTTWLGFLLAQVMKQDPQQQLGLDSFNKYVPDVNLHYTRRGSLAEFADFLEPRFFLCHACFDRNLPKVVYVMRDPRDVMVSYWHYQKLLNPNYDQSLSDFLRSKDHWPCGWDEHVAGWLMLQRHPNLMVVKYEDLHADAGRVLKGVLDFAGAEYNPARIPAAVQASNFAKMRAAEEKFGVSNKAAGSSERFMRKGRIGGWREEMSAQDVKILEEKYGAVMRAAGYPASQ
jgi:hypothetical protein